MSTTVDNRVVEMKFNNSNFEKNIKQSKESLEKFKESLNLSSAAEKANKNLSKAVSGVNFDAMSSALESISNRFSTLGIIGMTAIQNLTNSAISMVKKAVSSITNTIIEGGKRRAQNIENAKFQLAGLGIAWNDISADINYGVESTAYGLDAAAMAASQLSASGVKFGETFGTTGNSPMAKALRGISGLAAMTNSSYEDISRVFTTVAGNGRLMGDQLLQISSRGVNAAMEMVKFFNDVNHGSRTASDEVTKAIKDLTGGLDVSEAQLRDFVSKGKISFAMFSEAMDSAFGEHAKDANKTLQGVLSNIRSALSKIGADFWTPIIENEGKLVEMLNSVRVLINDVKSAIRDTLGWAADENGIEYLMKWKNLADGVFTTIKNKIDGIDRKQLSTDIFNIIKSIEYVGKSVVHIFDEIGKIAHSLGTAFKSVFSIEDSNTFTTSIRELLNRFRKFIESIKINGDTIYKVTNIFKGFFSVLDIGWQILKGVFGVIKDVVGAILPAGSGVLTLGSNVGQLLVRLDEFLKKSHIIRDVFETISNFLTPVIEGIRTFVTAVIEGFAGVTIGTGRAAEGFKNVTDKIKELSEKVKEFINRHMPKLTEGGFKLGEIFGKVGTAFGEIFKRLGDFASKIAPGIKTLLGSLLDLLDKVADSVIKIFNNLDFDKLTANFATGGIFATLLYGLKSIITNSTGFLNNIGEVLGTLEGKLTDLVGSNGSRASLIKSFATAIAILTASLVVLSSIDPERLAAPLAVLTTTIAAFGLAVQRLTPTFTSTTSIKKSITNFFDSLSFGNKLRDTTTSFIKMSAAIFILAGALRMLGELNPEQMVVALAGFSTILVEVVLLFKYLEEHEVTFDKGTASLIAFGIGVGILASTVKKLSNLSWNELAKGLTGLAAILGGIVGVAVTLKYTESDLKSFGMSLIPFAAGVAILASAVKNLAGLSWNQLAVGLTGFAAILGGIVGLAVSLKYTGASIKSLGLSLIPFATGVVILSEAVLMLSALNWNQLAVGLVGFAAILGGVAGLAITLEKTSSSLLSVGLAMIPFAAGVTILASAVVKLAGLSWSELARGLVGLAGALGGVAALALTMRYTGSSLTSTAAGLLVFAAAMRILLPVLTTFANMSWESLGKMILALAAALAVLGVAGMLLEPVVGVLVELGLAITLFGVGCIAAGAGITLLATGLTALGGSLAVVGVGLAAFIKAILSIIPEIVRAFGEIIKAVADVIANAIPSIVKAFVALLRGVCDAILQAAPMIFETIIKLLDMLIQYIPQIIDKVITIVIKVIEGVAARMPELVQAVAKFVKSFIDAVMDLFKDVTLTEFVNAIKSLSEAAALLAIVGAMGTAALAGLAILMAIIVGLGALVAGLGWLTTKISGLEDLLTNGIPILEKIGYAIGSFLGNIVGGALAGLSNGLPTIADNLSAFMTRLQPFIDGARNIDSSVAKGALTLAETILVLTASSLLNGIAEFLGADTSFATLGDQLVPFGESMKKFSESVAGLDAGVVENAANAGKAIAEMAAALPNSGGVAGFFAGENDMSMIGPQLEDFGKSIKAFADATVGLDAGVVENAANAGKAIAEMASTLPNSGGVLGFFAGENDMDTFGAQLVPFGIAMKLYSQAVTGINAEAVQASAVAGSALAAMADTVPNSGGVVGFFVGENDIDEFGRKLIPFGYAMNLYSQAVTGINAGAVVASAIAGAALAAMADTVPNTGGLISFFTGNNDLDTFGSQLIPFGFAMKAYSDAVAGINAGAVVASAIAGAALSALAATVPNTGGLISFFAGDNDMATFGAQLKVFGKSLADYSTAVSGMDAQAAWYSTIIGMALTALAATIPETGGLFSVFGGDNDMATFGAQLVLFGNALVNYSTTVANTDYASVSTAIVAINQLLACLKGIDGNIANAAASFKSAMETMASTSISGFVASFNGAFPQVVTAIKTSFDSAVTTIQSYQSQFKTEGSNFGKNLSTGISSQSNTVGQALITIIKALVIYLAYCEPTFQTEGQRTMQAYAKGFTAAAGSVQSAMKSVVNAAKGAVNISGDMYWAGVGAVQGFINGSYAMQASVYWTYYAIGRTAVNAAKQALDSHSPSREMFKLGVDSDRGLANGLTQFSYLVDDSSKKVANTALDTLRNSMSDISNVLEDSDFNPTITPVLDLSEIQNGMGSLSSLLGGSSTSVNLAGGLGRSGSGLLQNAFNDGRVINAINSINNRLDTVASRMENLQVVLDSGELVGATAPGMNNEFGTMDVLVQRGVM